MEGRPFTEHDDGDDDDDDDDDDVSQDEEGYGREGRFERIILRLLRDLLLAVITIAEG